MTQILVILAVASPVIRSRLRIAINSTPDFLILREAGTAAEAVQVILRDEPRVVLCDERMLVDPVLAELMEPGNVVPPMVLITVNKEAIPAAARVPVLGTLSLQLPPLSFAARLRTMLVAPPPLPRVQPPDLSHRFTVVSPDALPSHLQELEPAQRAPVTKQIRPVSRRHVDPLQDRLSTMLAGLQHRPHEHPRDPVTGFVGQSALDAAVTVLPLLPRPTAVVVAELKDEYGAGGHLAIDDALLRRMGAAIRANVRQDDLVCRTGYARFAVLMPGLERTRSSGALGRLHGALRTIGVSRQRGERGPRLSLGAGFWEPGMAPAQVLLQAGAAAHG